jgi:uncharacterized glyoxalase superfamily protein PhnB
MYLFLHTDDFWRGYKNMAHAGISFVRNPHTEAYGTIAVFEDLYGNLWGFIEPAQ